MPLNLRGLLALRAVMSEGTVTAAAQKLHRTQPAVSRLISQLEAATGIQLFQREGRRLIPTADGLAFYKDTERAFAALEDIESIARDIAARRKAPLRIIAQSHIVHGLLHIALGEFCARNRSFRFSLEIRENEYVSHWIANRLFDLGFVPQPVDDPGIEAILLFRAPLFVLLPKSHALALKSYIGIGEIANDMLIALRPGTPLRARLDAMCVAQGITPTLRGDTASVLSAGQLVSTGVGTTIADPFTANAFLRHPNVVIRPLKPRTEVEYFVLRSKGERMTAMAEEFVMQVKESARSVIEAIRVAASLR